DDAFARAGLGHLMALSGQNVALLVAAASFLLARAPLGGWRSPLLAGLLLAYLALVGASPSVVRAVLQGVVVLLALWAGRGRTPGLETLSLAGVAALLVFPAWVDDVGFQLSFLAVLGLLLTPRLESRLPGSWPRALRLALAGTLLAELATLPLVAHAFGSVPLVGL
ncbi:ComEC/Rec2 family competence protein, partial [Deinococcus pimensis]|uniref:ComEC/Rec2 family competence protein n=1 Tax=Deinococcus pimensis TaxID=309888 RepID=UPI0005EB6922